MQHCFLRKLKFLPSAISSFLSMIYPDVGSKSDAYLAIGKT